MKKQRIAALAALTALAGCMDDGRLPTESQVVQFFSHAAPTSVGCSSGDLIAAIDAANEHPTATLNLAAGCVYRLTTPNNISPVTGITGLPVITSTLTINGNGATIERVEGSDFRLFYVLNVEGPDEEEQGRGNLTVTNLKLRGGEYSNSGGALFNHGGAVSLTNVTIENSHSGDDGGGVHNFGGTLTLTNSTIRNNSASDHGGGVSNNLGVMTIVNTVIEHNKASDQGGGVANSHGSVVMQGSRIDGNDAGDSGGLYNEGGTVNITASRIENNTASDDGAGIRNLLDGTMTITSSVIANNDASDSGGGISNAGRQMFVFLSTIRGNHSSDNGAGITNAEGAELVITTSTISGNAADEDGGGLYNSGGSVTISNSTFSGNTAKYGGGLATEGGDDIVDGVLTNPGQLTLINTTVSGNTASEGGGGIYADKKSHLTVQFSTITNNTAQQKGGGGVLLYNDAFAQTRFMGTIVSRNSPNDVAAVERKSGTCCSEGFNLIGRAGSNISLTADFGKTGDRRNVTSATSVGLAALADNGGPTRTHALLSTSQALDNGGNICPAVDQRGVDRGTPCSIGAFQAAGTTQASQTITFPPPPSPQLFGASFTVTPFASSGLPVSVAASGACSISGQVVTMTAATGTCTLTASQSGSPDFSPAADVVRTVTAGPGAQTIVFTSTPPNPGQVGGTYVPTATGGSSGNPVTFSASGACTGSGVVNLTSAGTCTVTANQAGNSQFQAAAPVQQQFTVVVLSQINFKAGSNGQNGAATTLRINRPTTVTAGDFLLAQITFEKGSDAGSDAQITPAGWTLVRRTNNGSDIGQAIFRRVATASEPVAYTWTFSQSVKAVGGILVYTGVNASDPIVSSNGGAGVSSNLSAPSVSAQANGMLVALYGFKKKEVVLSAPVTGSITMIGRYNFENPNDLTVGAFDERRDTWPATTGSRTSTAEQPGSTSAVTEKFVAQLVFLRAN